jgi:hypothetical protein
MVEAAPACCCQAIRRGPCTRGQRSWTAAFQATLRKRPQIFESDTQARKAGRMQILASDRSAPACVPAAGASLARAVGESALTDKVRCGSSHAQNRPQRANRDPRPGLGWSVRSHYNLRRSCHYAGIGSKSRAESKVAEEANKPGERGRKGGTCRVLLKSTNAFWRS